MCAKIAYRVEISFSSSTVNWKGNWNNYLIIIEILNKRTVKMFAEKNGIEEEEFVNKLFSINNV